MDELKKILDDLDAEQGSVRIAGIQLHGKDATNFEAYRKLRGLTKAGAIKALSKIGLAVELSNEAAKQVGERYERENAEKSNLGIAA